MNLRLIPALLVISAIASAVPPATQPADGPMGAGGIRWMDVVLASLKLELVRLGADFPELAEARNIRIKTDPAGGRMELDYLHNCKYWGKRGYEDTGPNALAIALSIATDQRFWDDAAGMEMEAPSHRWPRLGLVGWRSLHCGKTPSPGLEAKLGELLRRHLAMIDQLERHPWPTTAEREASKQAEADRQADEFTRLTLEIVTQGQPFLPLEPMPITITLTNKTAVPLTGHALIDAGGFLNIQYAVGNRDFRKHDLSADIGHGDSADGERPLPPGFKHVVSGHLYYAHAPDPDKAPGTYLFEAPGLYRIKAALSNLRRTRQIESNVLSVTVRAPAGDEAQACEFLRSLKSSQDKDSQGRRPFYGAFLRRTYGHGLSDRDAIAVAKQEEFLRRFGKTRYAPYVMYSLGWTLRSQRTPESVERAKALWEKVGGYEDFFDAPSALVQLVETCLKANDLAGAREHLATLDARFPQSEEARYAWHRASLRGIRALPASQPAGGLSPCRGSPDWRARIPGVPLGSTPAKSCRPSDCRAIALGAVK